MKIKSYILAIFCTVLFFLYVLPAKAQKDNFRTAIVQEISGVPVFLFSEPLEPYKIVGKAEQNMEILLMDVANYTSITKKAKLMVDAARVRQQKGKLGEFDAIYVDLELSRSLAIKFTSGFSLKARTTKVRNVSVFFFSKPLNEYEEVVRLPSKSGNYEENGLLQDKVKSMINRALRRVKEGDIPAFDGIIFNPDDLSATAIKFK